MIKLSLTRLAIGAGVLGLSLTAGAGVASADPFLDPIVNTTCSYPQVVNAMNQENPGAATGFNSSPAVQSYLRKFLASPPNQRMVMAHQVQGMQGVDMGALQHIFVVCNNY